MKYLSLVIGLLIMLLTRITFAQEFSIKKVELTPESIILHYDLLDTTRGHTYTISLYTSSNNYTTPLQKVKGDVGLEVRPGTNKKIAWSSKEELGSTFNGEVELEVRGRVYIPFIKFEGFQEDQIIKRGKPRTITWSGGTGRNLLNFNLYKKGNDGNDEFIDVIPNIPNTGSYEIELPTSVKTGKGYYFLISDSKNKDQAIRTQPFQVKPKIPFAVKVLPIVAAGAVVYFLLPGSRTKDLDGPPEAPGEKN
jgi:hypothetical protein